MHPLEGALERSNGQIMRDKTGQAVQSGDEQREQKQLPQERQPSLPTPQTFYKKLVARQDIRAILKRLANN